MPQRASFGVNDFDAVSWTFAPNGFEKLPSGLVVHNWIVKSTTSPVLDRHLSHSVRESNAKPEDISSYRKVSPRKTETRLVVPFTYVDSTTGQNVLIAHNTFVLTGLFHPASPAALNKNMRVLMDNIVSNSQIYPGFDEGLQTW